jgi:cell division protein FtsW
VTAGVRSGAGALSTWWREVDRVALAAMIGLLAAGLLCSLAASPAAAARLGIEDPFHFLVRHAVFSAVSLALIVLVSMLDATTARRLAVLALLGSLVLLTATLFAGTEVNAARRWLRFGGLSFQPVEIAKPAFVVAAAWVLAEGRRAGGRAWAIAGLVATLAFATIAALLLAQPDFGQTVLLAAVFTGLAFLAGAPWMLMATLAVAGAALAAGAYLMLPHVAARVQAFLSPELGYQTGQALAAIRHGGLLGVGPGEGLVKRSLPDAHTDYVFAVAGEEFGVIFLLGLIGLIGTVVVRLLTRARLRPGDTASLAAGGIALLIGVQALINVAVNLNLAPPKGMTLPFVSYGGSSLAALGFAGGLALAFTRRPGEAREASRAARQGPRAQPAERSA